MEKQNLRKELVETTFKQLGLQAERKIAEHILRENLYRR